MRTKVITVKNQPLPDWKIHKVSKESVYPNGIFNFKNKYSVQTTTGDISANNEKISIPLLDPHAIAKHKQKYRYVHIGLVQAYARPIEYSGVNGSISLFLKDKRLFDFNDTFVNVPQASEINDPFNFFPNLMVSLEEVDVLHHLTLNVKLHNRYRESNKFVLSLICKVHYKWMRDQVNPGAAKNYGPGIEKVFRTRNMRSPKDLTPKTIKRSDLQFPEGWNVQDEIPEEHESNSPRFVYVSCRKVKLEFPRQ
ncbi:hypothetical protein LWI29_016356 [Acer saccharum]|uniref:Uncharacterized protein n=1 Tax=Acer saccharum TaxID=4024 RepID=A0AA39RYP0_ACESA|nr:hypothetical protein LWI29_020615 [Acer saccharum]KAK0584632.1 hypothetical protein LWI29_016356 [Acer saccharum]